MMQCQKCGCDLENPFFCRDCSLLQRYAELPNLFDTLNITPEFNLDLDYVESQYEDFLVEIHPDFFIGESEEDKRLSLKYASHLKFAKDSLSIPYERGLHLAEILYGKKPSEKDLMPSQAFLINMFEAQEDIESGKIKLETKRFLLNQVHETLEKMGILFDGELKGTAKSKFTEVASILGQLKFLQNLKDKIEAASL